jgi:hypothetical protein
MCLARIGADGGLGPVLDDDAQSRALLRLLGDCPPLPVVRALKAEIAAARQARGFAALPGDSPRGGQG